MRCQTFRRCCFNQLAFLINSEVVPHKDPGYVKGWTAIACFEDFEGRQLYEPDLGIMIPFKPDDIILFQLSLLEHWLQPLGRKIPFRSVDIIFFRSSLSER